MASFFGGNSNNENSRKRTKQTPLKTINIKKPTQCGSKDNELDLPTREDAIGDAVSIEYQTSLTPRKDDSDEQETKPSERNNEQTNLSKTQATPVDKLYNTKYLPKDDVTTYLLERFESNVMYIFNNYQVKKYEEIRKRDVLKLKNTFNEYNFLPSNIFEYTNYNRKDLRDVLKTFSQKDYTPFGCVVVVVLTHSKEGNHLWAQDDTYDDSELILPFRNNQTLVTKPKIFIVQACKCRETSARYSSVDGIDGDDDEDTTLAQKPYTISKEADILILYGSYDKVHGYSCDETKESWLIESLCKNVTEYADRKHFNDILIKMRNDVATKNPVTGLMDIHIKSENFLTRNLYFKKSNLN